MTDVVETTCTVVGGGPAGLMLGYLLARAGVDVVVLEKHADFLRDFRGDTIHPSTMEIMADLGLLDVFLKLPHQQMPQIYGRFGDKTVPVADFSKLPVRAPYIAMMPQWDFLNFLAERAQAFPNFKLYMRAEATGLVLKDGRPDAVRVRTPDGDMIVRSTLAVACDGRSSIMREAAGLEVIDLGAPMDVLWFRLSRLPGDTEDTQGRFSVGRIFIMLNRGDYWQCAYVIPKGANDQVRARGLPAFRDDLRLLLNVDPSRADELTDWDQIKLLVVQVNRLKTWWRSGLLCIGDAAHAMSPVGGVGVNLAVQDAVAAANILAEPLRTGTLSDTDLEAVQRRREWPTKVTQFMQVQVQKRIIAQMLGQHAIASAEMQQPPLVVRLLARFPFLRRFPARLIGIGVRPEHPRV